MFAGCKDGSIDIIDRDRGARPSNLVLRFEDRPDITAIEWSQSG